MFRALRAFFLLLFFANCCYAGSEKDSGLPPAKVIKNISEIKIPDKKQYPPYPDVSGYDLSAYQAVKEGVSGITAYRMDDGDIWFTFAESYKDVVERRGTYRIYKDYTGVKFILLKFFSGERTELTESQINELHKLLKPKEMVPIHNILTKHDWPWVKFSDGSEVVYEYGTGGSLCSHFEVARSFLVKKSPDGKTKAYSLVSSYPKVSMREDQGMCEMAGAEFLYEKLYFFPQYVIDLGDDTFIVASGYANFIIRLDKEFNTKFTSDTPLMINDDIYINRNFFIFDREVLYEIAQDVYGFDKPCDNTLPHYQTLHNKLLIYLEKKYRLEKID